MSIQSFQVNVSKSVLEDLQRRLAMTRWPDELAGAGWDYGIPLAYMKDVVDYWSSEFDWTKIEKRINSFSNFTACVDGMNIHFVHERGKGPNPKPLLLLHGWPSTFYEMLDLVPYLTDPVSYGGDNDQSFDVIIPSIPGHGFSSTPTAAGFEDRQAAHLLVGLMKQLGYERFGIHAYDLGASISGLLCLDRPEIVIGYHTTSAGNPGPSLPSNQEELTQAERDHLAYMKSWGQDEGGYASILGTRPQTFAYGLNDSPAGLAAFILEKWYAWTAPPSGELDKHFSKDDLLANVMIYWVTETINAANRYYYEGRHIQWPGPNEKITVPTGIALPATQPIERPPLEYVERLFTNVIKWEELGACGHFAALEQPKLVASKMHEFFKAI